MKVELHLHTSRHSPCARHRPEELLARLVATGYDAVYLTEHDALWGEDELAALQEQFPEIRLFPGIERSIGPIRDGQHLLILGARDPEYTRLTEPSELLALARTHGHLAILAHPLRSPDSAAMLMAGLRPDALECRTGSHDEARANMIARAAVRLRLPLVNAGDVHRLVHVNKCWIETLADLHHADDIRDVIRSGLYSSHTRDLVPAAYVE
ncbi:MAG: hypothetical protein NT031_06970 [Planctomycetota bacterium]|nr:hypothetical protein [Planctomycetota bacterium]